MRPGSSADGREERAKPVPSGHVQAAVSHRGPLGPHTPRAQAAPILSLSLAPNIRASSPLSASAPGSCLPGRVLALVRRPHCCPGQAFADL